MSEASQSKLTLSQLLDTLGDLSELGEDPELQLVELNEGEVLFEQGDEAAGMYVLLAGVLGVRVQHDDGTETVIDRLAPGAIVGEMALLSGQKRTATVFAINDAGVIRLSKAKFEQLAEEDQDALETIDETVAPRWQRLQLARVMNNLFGELDTSALHTLQRQMTWQHHSNGSVIFKQGDEGDGMYIVVNGRLRVTVTTPQGEENVIGEIGPGETVGEFAVLTDDVRSATVHAVRETNLALITPSVFRNLSQEYPELMGKLVRIIVERQQRSLKGIVRPSPTAQTITLLPISPTVDSVLFASELSGALSQYGTTVTLSSQEFDDRYGKPGASQTALDDASNPAIVDWMGDLEGSSDFIIYTADDESSNWTRRCIGQADRVLLIADPEGDPKPGLVEHMLEGLDVPIRTELVLWHPAGTERPVGTSAWLEPRQEGAHYHVRREDASHMSRLARRLSGHAISMVLSGGGARGFAQLGVYRSMLELGIPIDYVGGSSFGALMAGLFARSLSVYELMDLADAFASSRQIFDYTLPFTSLLASKKVTRICQEVFGDVLIEDLWFPFFCVSSNLSCAEPVIHRRGPLWRAVRASLAIPGVFAPVIEDDEILVDGGVMDNFPVELMVKLSESDHVIGVHANPHKENKRQWDYDTSISGWRILFNKINPFAKPLRSPSLIGTILRAQEINSAYQAKSTEYMLDLLIRLEVKQYGFMDFDEYEAIAQSGYEATLEPLREWKESRGIKLL